MHYVRQEGDDPFVGTHSNRKIACSGHGRCAIICSRMQLCYLIFFSFDDLTCKEERESPKEGQRNI